MISPDSGSAVPTQVQSQGIVAPSGSGGPFAKYLFEHAGYDEFRSPSGQRRPHWDRVIGHFERLGAKRLREVNRQANSVLAENGVSYHVYLDEQEVARPWQFDAVPYLFSPEDWQRLSTGLKQRSHLIEEVLADLYGPQKLLREGVLPPALLYAHPNFLRPMHRLVPPRKSFLPLSACELARSPSGEWWVMADRCMAPRGLGYALENRFASARGLQRVFVETHVKALAPFFRKLKDNLAGLSPRNQDDPTVVLFSEGPKGRYYFEDSYLSRYLDYPLVEGGDLTVRDQQVFMKTVTGLDPVDVLYRRVADAEMDPLELGATGNSISGVPGLIECLREKTVAVANPLGSGLLELPVFMAFLGPLSKVVLGEELKLPSIATWWLGDDRYRCEAFSRMDELVFKPAFKKSGGTEIFGNEQSAEQRRELIARIEAEPELWVAQNQVQRSASPCWTEQGMRPGYVAFRMFLTSDGESIDVMPGGLVRTTPRPGPFELSVSAGDQSKDAWVFATDDSDEPAGRRREESAITIHSQTRLLSRSADNLYWLGRAGARAESAARVMRVLLRTLMSEGESEAGPDRHPLLETLFKYGLLSATERRSNPVPEGETLIERAAFATGHGGSLFNQVQTMVQTASQVRDRLSNDTWRILNRTRAAFRPPDIASQVDDATAAVSADIADVPGTAPLTLLVLDELLLNLSAYRGQVTDAMTRGPVWLSHEIGRRVEWSYSMVDLLTESLKKWTPQSNGILQGLLEVCESLITYRSRYRARLQLAPVLHLLVTDELNPRSLVFQLATLEDLISRLPREAEETGPSVGEQATKFMLYQTRLWGMEGQTSDPDRKPDPAKHKRALLKHLEQIKDHLGQLHAYVEQRYLILIKQPQRLISF